MPSTSSRKIEPLWANSKSPSLPPFLAPVNEPSSYPKSSLSRRLSGMAAQFMAMKGYMLRFDSLCMACAKSSFPVPLSPVISTAELFLAIFLAMVQALLIESLSPIIS